MHLDPTFKVMPFLSEAERSDVHFAVNFLIRLLCSTEGSEHSEQSDQQETAQQAAKRKLSKFFDGIL